MIKKIINYLFKGGKKVVKKTARIYSNYESDELNRLKMYGKKSEYDNKYYYLTNGDKVQCLGLYSYYDVDGTVSRYVIEKNDGEIINCNWYEMFEKPPHKWAKKLDILQLISYNEDFHRYLKNGFYTEEDLINDYKPKLSKKEIRENKIDNIING